MATRPDNPWTLLPNECPFVLAQDKEQIDRFNSTPDDRLRIPLDVFPEPYLGNPAAPVVLLGLNPGSKDTDRKQHSNPQFAARLRANLLHEPAAYPFYLLDPTIERTKWWDKKLHWLMKEFDRKTVAREVFCVEFFPYHSRRFGHADLCIPSQQYSFLLVRQAIARGAVILQLRGNRHWLRGVPELRDYKRLYGPRSVQNPAISPCNFPDGFKAAVQALRGQTGKATKATDCL